MAYSKAAATRQQDQQATRAPEHHGVRPEHEALTARENAHQSIPTDPAELGTMLSRADGASRSRIVLQLQRTHGNAFVQRIVRQATAPAPARSHAREEGANRMQVATTSPDRVQRGFWSRLWSGIRSIGSAIGSALGSAFSWLGERLGDAARWVVNLVRDLPQRLARLGRTILDALQGVATFIPDAIRALASGGLRGFGDWLWERLKAGGAWALQLITRVFDTLGGPEIIEFLEHIFSKVSRLSGEEEAAAKSVMGPSAIRWGQVRIGEGGFLSIVFRFNEARAFTTWHTINLPPADRHNLAIIVHELVHVYQYEKVGSWYLPQAAHAQMTIGYGYGGAAGLTRDRAAGKHYAGYNREQQAQIAQDYYTLKQGGGSTEAYEPFIAELRSGAL